MSAPASAPILLAMAEAIARAASRLSADAELVRIAANHVREASDALASAPRVASDHDAALARIDVHLARARVALSPPAPLRMVDPDRRAMEERERIMNLLRDLISSWRRSSENKALGHGMRGVFHDCANDLALLIVCSGSSEPVPVHPLPGASPDAPALSGDAARIPS